MKRYILPIILLVSPLGAKIKKKYRLKGYVNKTYTGLGLAILGVSGGVKWWHKDEPWVTRLKEYRAKKEMQEADEEEEREQEVQGGGVMNVYDWAKYNHTANLPKSLEKRYEAMALSEEVDVIDGLVDGVKREEAKVKVHYKRGIIDEETARFKLNEHRAKKHELNTIANEKKNEIVELNTIANEWLALEQMGDDEVNLDLKKRLDRLQKPKRKQDRRRKSHPVISFKKEVKKPNPWPTLYMQHSLDAVLFRKQKGYNLEGKSPFEKWRKSDKRLQFELRQEKMELKNNKNNMSIDDYNIKNNDIMRRYSELKNRIDELEIYIQSDMDD